MLQRKSCYATLNCKQKHPLTTVEIDAAEDKITAIHDSALAACRAASIDLCTFLESRTSTGRHASASLKFRAKPSGIITDYRAKLEALRDRASGYVDALIK